MKENGVAEILWFTIFLILSVDFIKKHNLHPIVFLIDCTGHLGNWPMQSFDRLFRNGVFFSKQGFCKVIIGVVQRHVNFYFVRNASDAVH